MLFVGGVGLRTTARAELENVAAEEKRMTRLSDPHVKPGRRQSAIVGESEHDIALAMLLNPCVRLAEDVGLRKRGGQGGGSKEQCQNTHSNLLVGEPLMGGIFA